MSQTNSVFFLPDAPSIAGLTFRLFREGDISALEEVRTVVRALDGDLWMPGPDTQTNAVCDPMQDCLLVEVAGQVIGYTWLDWWTENKAQLYLHLGWLLPQWRRKGIGRALLHWQEHRLRQIAQTHQAPVPCVFGATADETQLGNRALLLSEGYQLAFTRVHMARQLPQAPIQLAPLPSGLEIRSVTPEHLPLIYMVADAVFVDTHGYGTDSYEDFLKNLGWPHLETDLWFVAWDDEQIAGLVLNMSEADSAFTSWVAVRDGWRRRGLAKALMTRTLRRFQERGMRHAALETNAEDPGNPVHLYERVGYQVVKRHPRYRKPMEWVIRNGVE